jgi:hypothetical protein
MIVCCIYIHAFIARHIQIQRNEKLQKKAENDEIGELAGPTRHRKLLNVRNAWPSAEPTTQVPLARPAAYSKCSSFCTCISSPFEYVFVVVSCFHMNASLSLRCTVFPCSYYRFHLYRVSLLSIFFPYTSLHTINFIFVVFCYSTKMSY